MPELLPRDDGTIQWESIHEEYRAGVLSIREIGRRYGVSEGAIRKRARAGGWERDLSEDVRRETRNASVRREVRSSDALDDQDIVHTFAERGAEVEAIQRKQVQYLMGLGETLLCEVANSEAELPKRTACFRDLAQAIGRLIPLQRQMYRLDEEAQDRESSSLEARLQAGIERVRNLG